MAPQTSADIWVSYTFEGWHRWPDAPEHRDYLSNRHRHLFGVRATIQVEHDDREIEYHDLLDVCKAELSAVPESGQSCEHMARHLATALTNLFPGRPIEVTVDEDGECGSTVRA